jgi:hypothetical protein
MGRIRWCVPTSADVPDNESLRYAESFGELIGVMIEVRIVVDVPARIVDEVCNGTTRWILPNAKHLALDRREDRRSPRRENIGCSVNSPARSRRVECVRHARRLDALDGNHQRMLPEVFDILRRD